MGQGTDHGAVDPLSGELRQAPVVPQRATVVAMGAARTAIDGLVEDLVLSLEVMPGLRGGAKKSDDRDPEGPGQVDGTGVATDHEVAAAEGVD